MRNHDTIFKSYGKRLKNYSKCLYKCLYDFFGCHSNAVDVFNQVWEAKFTECTFRPRVNQRPPEEDDLTYSRFDQLFWDAENRRRRQAEYDQWYPEGLAYGSFITHISVSFSYFMHKTCTSRQSGNF